MGAHAAVRGTAGAVQFELQVPNYDKGVTPHEWAGLDVDPRQLTPTPRPDPELAELFPTLPSAERVFRADETVGRSAPAPCRREAAREDFRGAHAYTTYRGVLKQPEKQKGTRANSTPL